MVAPAPDVEQLAQGRSSQCSRLASSARVSGQKLLTFRNWPNWVKIGPSFHAQKKESNGQISSSFTKMGIEPPFRSFPNCMLTLRCKYNRG